MRLNSGIAQGVCVAVCLAALSGCVHHQQPATPVQHHATKKAPMRSGGTGGAAPGVGATPHETVAGSSQHREMQSHHAEAAPMPPLHRPAAGGSAAHSTVDAASMDYMSIKAPSDKQLNDWYNGLSNGLVEYAVPSKIYLGDTATVSVRIHGSQSQTTGLAGRTGSGSFKVSTHMQAQLGQSANPGVFDIDPAGPVQKTVMDSGDNTWTWTVHAKRAMATAQLDIQIWVLYPGQEASDQQPVVSTTIPVQVAVPPVGEVIRQVVPQDPQTIAQQLFPKGIWASIGAALLWLVHWAKKRFFPEQGAAPVAHHDDAPET